MQTVLVCRDISLHLSSRYLYLGSTTDYPELYWAWAASIVGPVTYILAVIHAVIWKRASAVLGSVVSPPHTHILYHSREPRQLARLLSLPKYLLSFTCISDSIPRSCVYNSTGICSHSLRDLHLWGLQVHWRSILQVQPLPGVHGTHVCRQLHRLLLLGTLPTTFWELGVNGTSLLDTSKLNGQLLFSLYTCYSE